MPATDASPRPDLPALLAAQRAAFAREPMPDAATRRARLAKLSAMLRANQDALCAAIAADFGHRPANETRLLELFTSLEAIGYARRRVARWMQPQRRAVSIWFQPGRCELRYQPLGVVGIVVPWNYPLYLSIGPLAGALAAGNRVLIKPSEFGPAFAELLARLIAQSFPADLVSVVQGGPELAAAFCALPFDHLLFTGSTEIGRRVMAAAAANLTPVTLELGGKSPALIAPGYDLARAARDIAFGKFANAGQTCIAPDYVLLPRGQEASFVELLRAAVADYYRDVAGTDYASIAHDRHYARLQALLDDARAQGARVLPLLPGMPAGRKLAPMALLQCSPQMRVLQEEIFGPLLPVLSYDTLEQACSYINGRDRPLALYVFDHDRARCERLLDATASGGVTVNDCLLHIAQDDLPFGGVGPSGMGRYHGHEGFLTFSQQRPVFRQARLNFGGLLRPPFPAWKQRLISLLLR